MIQAIVEQHTATLNEAVSANLARTYYSHWNESPSPKVWGEDAPQQGEQRFKDRLNKPFEGLLQQGASATVGEEASPYGFNLGITYPSFSVEQLVAAAQKAQVQWQSLSPLERAAVLIETLEKATPLFFELAYATMHTTGQGFAMSFQASGPHAYDRALEAIAMGYAAQTSSAPSATWTKPLGRMSVTLEKKFRIVPRGAALTIGCSTFPTWNTLPGVFAALATGNPAIIKPHPKAVLPIALVVASMQQTLQQLGLDPHIIQLACDTTEQPLALHLANHPDIKQIDFTGGAAFGTTLEKVAAEHNKLIFAEKSGVNVVLLESVANLDAVLENIAFSLSLYSGQMCTAPQNIFINQQGVLEGETRIPFEEVTRRLAEKISGLVGNEKMGPPTVGAIQSEATAARVQKAAALGLPIIRNSEPVAQAGFEHARTASPLVLLSGSARHDIYEHEWFGPISFVIPVDSFQDGVQLMERSIASKGALTALVYSTDEDQCNVAEDKLTSLGVSTAFNFTGPIWVNQSAAFSDFHGAANPAANAQYADMSFVARRFAFVGVRRKID